jgi:hypothetical protein
MADSMSSQQAVGSIETKGFPAVLAAADAMLKAGRVTLVGYLRAGSARFTVNIRGDGGWCGCRRESLWWDIRILGDYSSSPS